RQPHRGAALLLLRARPRRHAPRRGHARRRRAHRVPHRRARDAVSLAADRRARRVGRGAHRPRARHRHQRGGGAPPPVRRGPRPALRPDLMAEPPFTDRELMVVAAGREIADGDVVFVGMRLPLVAFAFAKRTHAPGALGVFENGLLRDHAAPGALMTMSDTANVPGALWSAGT